MKSFLQVFILALLAAITVLAAPMQTEEDHAAAGPSKGPSSVISPYWHLKCPPGSGPPPLCLNDDIAASLNEAPARFDEKDDAAIIEAHEMPAWFNEKDNAAVIETRDVEAEVEDGPATSPSDRLSGDDLAMSPYWKLKCPPGLIHTANGCKALHELLPPHDETPAQQDGKDKSASVIEPRDAEVEDEDEDTVVGPADIWHMWAGKFATELPHQIHKCPPGSIYTGGGCKDLDELLPPRLLPSFDKPPAQQDESDPVTAVIEPRSLEAEDSKVPVGAPGLSKARRSIQPQGAVWTCPRGKFLAGIWCKDAPLEEWQAEKF